MQIDPIPNEPALLLKDENKNEDILVASDFHIGIEYELLEKGINLPSQTKKMLSHLQNLIAQYNIDHLIILGDVKHKIPSASRQEYFEVPEFFDALREKVEVIDLVIGNHDGNIRSMVRDVDVHPSTGFCIGNIGLYHGHTWPSKEVMKCETILTAHNHPTVLFIDKLGSRSVERCWVRANLLPLQTKNNSRYQKIGKELIILPAFNELLGGTPLNEKRSKLLGPVPKKMIDLESARIYLLDGTFLGKLKDLRV
jgi:putative SbcD/Mre11-related phosphoesterase